MPTWPEPAGEVNCGELGLQRWVVVAPTYNHARALEGVLAELDARGLDVIAVNDGASDETDAILDRWSRMSTGDRRRVVLRHEVNKGKAAALLTGFAEATRLGYTHAATIDTDGQHDVADLVRLIALSASHAEALVIGARETAGEKSSPREGAPTASRLGRLISNWMVWAESGVRVSDSQSGMRVYPLAQREMLAARASRYCFETEVLVLAGWAGVEVIEQGIRSIYVVEGGRTTHFRLWRDTARSVRMHAGLLARALLPRRRTAHATELARKRALARATTGTIPARLASWFSLRRLAEMAGGDASLRERLAASVGVGMFMAVLPIYGVKTVVCLWLSARFRLHPLAVIGVSSLSTPPVGLVFVAVSICVGAVLLRGQLPDLGAVNLAEAGKWSTVNALITEWLIGSVIAGLVLGLTAYGVMRAALRRPRLQGPAMPTDAELEK